MTPSKPSGPYPPLKYWDGYRYVVAEDIAIRTAITGYAVVDLPRSMLDRDGLLLIKRGYAWDGNSGPLPELPTTRLASLVHDVLCEYISLGLLPECEQPKADQEYYAIAVSRGLWWRLARQIMLAIRWFQTGKRGKRYHRPVLRA